MTTLRALLERRAAIAAEMRQINDAAGDNDLGAEQRARFDALKTDLGSLEERIARQSVLEDAERRAQGQPYGGTGDRNLDRETQSVGLMDAVRAQLGATDRRAGLARELSQEHERRSGRRAQGLFWSMGAEERVQTSGSSPLVPTDHRPDLFIDRLRNRTRLRALGSTMLTGIHGNLSIPRRTGSSSTGWVAENAALTASDPTFDAVTLSPKHCGAITEWSRNMIQQASPDVEQLARNDLALQLAEALDAAGINGTGSSNQPLGILGTSGIGSVAMGTNGGALTADAVRDLVGKVDDANADAGSLAFLTNTKVKTAALKLKDAEGKYLGLDVVFPGAPAAFSNVVPGNLSKGTSSGVCSALVYGNWADLLVGVWSELDILVNPYESTAYSKGNVSIRAMMTVDIAVRHAASFAAIQDITTA
jgi:HK97 family phage major capsid protein